jgi:hypothetical protein
MDELKTIWKEIIMVWDCPAFVIAPVMNWPKHIPNINVEHCHQTSVLGAVVNTKKSSNISATFFGAIRHHHHALDVKIQG